MKSFGLQMEFSFASGSHVLFVYLLFRFSEFPILDSKSIN